MVFVSRAKRPAVLLFSGFKDDIIGSFDVIRRITLIACTCAFFFFVNCLVPTHGHLPLLLAGEIGLLITVAVVVLAWMLGL